VGEITTFCIRVDVDLPVVVKKKKYYCKHLCDDKERKKRKIRISTIEFYSSNSETHAKEFVFSQGGEDPSKALTHRSLSADWPLITGLYCEK